MSNPTRSLDLTIAGAPAPAQVSQVTVENTTILLHAVGNSLPDVGVFFPVTIGDGNAVSGLADLTDWEIRQALLDSAIHQAAVVAGGVAELALIQPAAELDVEDLEAAADNINNATGYRNVVDVQEAIDSYRFDPDA